MAADYLLSIVVPTKNRYQYLKKLIELYIKLGTLKVELVIQDNSDTNKEILEYLNEVNSPTIKYFYEDKHLSVSENSNLAVLNSTGEYICFLGDDDGFVLNIVECVSEMKEMGLEAAIFPQIVYNWPDFYDNSLFKLYSTLQMPKSLKSFNSKWVKLDAKAELDDIMKKGFPNLGRMPRVYQGIVKRGVLDEVYKRCDTVFPGSSPDMGNAVALSTIVKNFAYKDSPIIISGQGSKVGGGERVLGRNNLMHIKDRESLPSDILERWSPFLPPYWCTETIWPQSAYETYNKLGISTELFNWDKILARFCVFHHHYYNEAKANFCSSSGYFYMLTILLNKVLVYFADRLLFFVSRGKRTYRNIIRKNVRDIIEAEEILC